MTKIKPSFTEIIDLDKLTIKDAGSGMRWATFPSGNPINSKNSRYMLTVGGKTYVSHLIDNLIIMAFRDGKIDLHKHGYDTCHRCNGTGKLSHYSHVNSGTCFKCKGFGII